MLPELMLTYCVCFRKTDVQHRAARRPLWYNKWIKQVFLVSQNLQLSSLTCSKGQPINIIKKWKDSHKNIPKSIM